jgi:hypothetical protein
MHTIMVIAGGFILLLANVLLAYRLGDKGTASVALAAKVFIPLWLVFALINMWVGVATAGYTVAEEAPILLVVFGVPAAVAAFLWWYYGR